jgi:hypothetical protein
MAEDPPATAIFIGGARLGWLGVTWPLAMLRVNNEALVLRAVLLGRRRFAPSEVVELRPVTWFPLLAWGVRIVHHRSDTPENLLFWSIRPPGMVVRAIERVGFVPAGGEAPTESTATDPSPSTAPAPAGLAFRPELLVLVIFASMVAFLFDLFTGWTLPGLSSGGPGIIAWVAFAFVASLLIRRPGWMQRLALSSPEALPRALPMLNLATLISGLLLVSMLYEIMRALAG